MNMVKLNMQKAVEMKYRALENLGEKKNEKERERKDKGKKKNVEEVVVTWWHICGKRTISCRNGKLEGMQLRKQRLEAESKKEEQSKKQHQDLMQVMLQQTKQQQEQMQNFQKMFTLMQQQQSQIIIKLLEKQN